MDILNRGLKRKENSGPGWHQYVNTYNEKFDSLHKKNKDLSVDTKISTLKVSRSVVSVTAFSDKEHFMGSGTIIRCDKVDDAKYVSTVLTSACLIGQFKKDAEFQVVVFSHDGGVYKVLKFDYDVHYNVALLKIESIEPMLVAILKTLKVIGKAEAAAREEELQSAREEEEMHSETDAREELRSEAFHVCSGDEVIAVGRYFRQPYKPMAAPGKFSDEWCNMDCPLMLKSTCNISKCGTGGPLINGDGEVIGINFFLEEYTPFLPMNIVLKCLEHFERHGKFVRPNFGVKGANLSATTSLERLEKIVRKVPDFSTGILVKEVVPMSPAYHAGIRAGDVLLRCNGDIIQSIVEFEAILLDKIGESVEVQLLSKLDKIVENTVVVEELTPDKFYRWCLPERRWVFMGDN